MTLLKMDPAERAVLDQVAGWRRVRISWQGVGRSLGLTGEAARARYEALLPGASVAPPRAVEVRCEPGAAPRRSKPRRARSVPAQLGLTPRLKALTLKAAVEALGMPAEAVATGQGGNSKARLAAAYAFALHRGCVKRQAAEAFAVNAPHLNPSGLAMWLIPDAAIAAIVAALRAAE